MEINVEFTSSAALTIFVIYGMVRLAIDIFCGLAKGFNKILDRILKKYRRKVMEDKNKLWHDAHGDYLPEYGRTVIVIANNLGLRRATVAHRPNPNGYAIVNGEKLYPQTYGEGGWNLPNIVWWLDLDLPYKD